MFSQFKICLYMNIACGFGIPMWVIHFEVKGPPKVKLGPTNASFDMTFTTSIAYWVIDTTC